MYSPTRCAAAITRSPLRATTWRPLIVKRTALGSGGGVGTASLSDPAAFSVVVIAGSHRHRDQVALHDLGLELVAEQREGGVHRHICGRADETDRGHLVREGNGIDT